jgi:hypothetical protein
LPGPTLRRIPAVPTTATNAATITGVKSPRMNCPESQLKVFQSQLKVFLRSKSRSSFRGLFARPSIEL